jgi:hypothetical protein
MITFHVEERSAYKYEFEDNPWSLLQIYRSMSLRPDTGQNQRLGLWEAVGTKLNKSLESNSTDKEFITAFNKIQKFIGSRGYNRTTIGSVWTKL